MTLEHQFNKAAQWIADADGLIIAAGAGMGVDSGLPDFRGNAGFWRHYPALGNAQIDFQSMASPTHFVDTPDLAWGFYGHRLAMYRETPPHDGFRILRDIADTLRQHAFIYTSNVDGQFQKSGFDDNQVYECHGSLHHLQCSVPCSSEIWSANDFKPQVDVARCRLINALPVCRVCAAVARPNVLMFGDGDWVSRRSDAQRERLAAWLPMVQNPVIVELGAGTAVPTVRYFSERTGFPLVRINVREAHAPAHQRSVCLPSGALQALQGIEQALTRMSQ